MKNNNLNLVVTIILSLGIIWGWHHYIEGPKIEKVAAIEKQRAEKRKAREAQHTAAPELPPQRNDVIVQNPRIIINSEEYSGSINLRGARIDDLVLEGYKETLDPDSKNVALFSPSSIDEAYFAETGWSGVSADLELPNNETIWEADKMTLNKGETVTLHWSNSQDIKFIQKISLGDDYMFTIEQIVSNGGSKVITLQPFGILFKAYQQKDKLVNILHQGPIGVYSGKLEEVTYDKLKDAESKIMPTQPVSWLGFTDKYWLGSFVPDQQIQYRSNYNYNQKNGLDRYQISFIGEKSIIEPDEEVSYKHHLFAGPKKLRLLDHYESALGIPLFDRAIDFGWYYILTKPMFNALNFFYSVFGNFGISILFVTIIVKLLMFSVANKSFRSMKRMKELQPEIERLKNLYGDDKMKFNQEIMALYRREKVNPVSGCLPLLVQIPVFFSLYKVLYVSIEMRHAPFFGWIQDLSAPDPTTIFNLFGLIPYDPPSFLYIGVWPILMAITMFLQQKMNPAPADPLQAKMMKFMPLIFLVMFSKFSAGLVIYWTWSNILSIVQQYFITKYNTSDK